MSDDVIKNFMVSLGFKGDEGQAKKAVDLAQKTEDAITKAAAQNAAKREALEQSAVKKQVSLKEQLGALIVGLERDRAERVDKVQKDQAERAEKRDVEDLKRATARRDALLKSTRALAVGMAGIVTGLAAGVTGAATGLLWATDRAAKHFERLAYAAQNSASSARGLSRFVYQATQLGDSAEDAQGSLAAFGDNLKKLPALEGMLKGMGIATRDMSGHMREAGELAAEYIGHLKALPQLQREAQAGAWGLSEGTVRAVLRPGFAGFGTEYDRIQGTVGADPNAAAQGAIGFEQAMRRGFEIVGAIKTRVETALFDFIRPRLDDVAKWVLDHGDAISNVVTQISKGLTDLATAFVKSDVVQGAISGLGDGLERFAKYVSSDQFKRDVTGFVDDVKALAHAIRWALEAIGVLPSRSGAAVIPDPEGSQGGDGSVAGGTGPGSTGIGASLHNRRGSSGKHDTDFAKRNARIAGFKARDVNPEVADYIARAAAARGIDPRVALAVAATEGLNGYDPSKPDHGGDQGTSFGPFQLHYKSNVPGFTNAGMGDDFTRATGKDAHDPSTWKAQVDFALDHAAKNGWSAWHGWNGNPARAGLGMDPSEAARLIPQRSTPSSPVAAEVDPSGMIAGDLSGQATYSRGQLDDVKGFIVHHTGGGGTPEGVVQTLNQRGLGVQFVMDRDGKIYRTLPDGARGAHILRSEINDLSNANTEGMEVIAKNDNDVTPAQVAAGRAFVEAMARRYPGLQVFGHGEVNPHHKMASEGHAIVAAIRADLGNPHLDPNYKPAPVPLAQRTLQGYMGRDPVKVAVTDDSAFRLGKAFASSSPLLQVPHGGTANILAGLHASWQRYADAHGMDLRHPGEVNHPYKSAPPLGVTPQLMQAYDNSSRRGDTHITHSPTFNVSGGDVRANMEAARMVADRGPPDLVRNMRAVEQ